MFIGAPATRNAYQQGFYGHGVRERVGLHDVLPGIDNGFGLMGLGDLGAWYDGIDWGSIIETGAKTAGTIAVGQFGTPKLTAGQSIQRVKNADGSYSEVLMQQPPGTAVGMGPAVTAGLTSSTVMVLGLGAVVLFVVMQGRGR